MNKYRTAQPTEVKKWDTKPKLCACTLPHDGKIQKVEALDAFGLRKFFICIFITRLVRTLKENLNNFTVAFAYAH